MEPRILFVLAWGVTNLTLLSYLGAAYGWGDRLRLDLPTIQVGEPGKVDLAVLPEFALPKLEQHFKQTLARPLFVPTRLPAPPPPPPPPPAPPPKPTMVRGQFLLMGVIMYAPDTNIAILREVANGKTHRVPVGKMVNGILVKEIYEGKVMLAQYDETELVTLKVHPSKPVADQAQAASPAQSAVRPGRANRRPN